MAVHKDRITELEVGEYIDTRLVGMSPWLAAVLTLKGTFDLGISRASHNKENLTPMPYLCIHDKNHPERIKVLSQMYGNDSANPSMWELRGRKAIQLIQLCAPFLPSRRESIKKCMEIESQLDFQSRQRVLRAPFNDPEDDDISIEDYKKLLKFKFFPAGIVDMASFTVKKVKDRPRGVIMSVQTTKKNLLVALQSKYLGSVGIAKYAGRSFEINGRTSEVKRNIWSWKLGHSDTIRLINDIREHSLIAYQRVDQMICELEACVK